MNLSHNAAYFIVPCLEKEQNLQQLREFLQAYDQTWKKTKLADLEFRKFKKLPIWLSKLRVLDLSGNTAVYVLGNSNKNNSVASTFPRLQNLILNEFSWKIYHKGRLLETGIGIAEGFFGSPSLTNLSLANTGFDFSSDGMFVGSPFSGAYNLRRLVLDNNDFSHMTENRFVQVFRDQQQLRYLSLRNCRLEYIMHFSVVLPRLSVVNMSHNNILAIPDGVFDSLSYLSEVDLSFDYIRTVSEETFSEKLRRQLKLIDLRENSLYCTCDTLWLQDWLRSAPQVFYPGANEKHFYRCRNFPDTLKFMEDFTMEKQSCIFRKETSLLVILTSSIAICTLLLTMFLFKYRWHFRLLFYEAFRGKGNARQERLQQNRFDYDVFVSYASEDLPWVREHLMPELEDLLGLRLCVHERDFIPGKNIVDNIADCVESSKKMMMVFSNSFVTSQWCQFELAYCLSYVLDYDDALIVVCVDDVASREMTSSMRAVTKTVTCIQWDQHVDARASFWGRIQLALNEIFQHIEHHV